MFRWLFGRKQAEEDFDYYKPKERLIYRYFDGQKIVIADPMRLYKRIMEHWADLDSDLKVAMSARTTNIKSADNLDTKLRMIFGVKPVHEGGLTDLEMLDLFDHFMVYANSIKKNSSEPPTDSMESSLQNSSATKPPSVSGSTGTESSTGVPPSLPLESVLVSASSTPASTTTVP